MRNTSSRTILIKRSCNICRSTLFHITRYLNIFWSVMSNVESDAELFACETEVVERSHAEGRQSAQWTLVEETSANILTSIFIKSVELASAREITARWRRDPSWINDSINEIRSRTLGKHLIGKRFKKSLEIHTSSSHIR